MKQLIWFQHMHKSAGTSIFDLAKYNGIKIYPQNNNGNPLYGRLYPRLPEDINNAEIPFYDFLEPRRQSFIDRCLESKIQFIGCEWGFPKNCIFDSRLLYLTCMRDPWTRFVSNFNFDYTEHVGPTDLSLELWLDVEATPHRNFARSNYYTFTLAGLNKEHIGPITEEHFQTAISNLRKFDIVMVLEHKHCFEFLKTTLGWSASTKSIKSNSRRLDPRVTKIVESYKGTFITDNVYDYRLYEEAKRLMANQVDQYKPDLIKHNRIQSFQTAHMLDKQKDKNHAVELHMLNLKRCNSLALATIDPKLLDMVEPINSYEIINIDKEVTWILQVLYHLSYLCFYTKYKSLGKTICQILLDTKVKFEYQDRIGSVMSYYEKLEY